MKGVALKTIDIHPDLNSIEADRMLIEQTASYVANLWPQMNTAEMYVVAGREFKNLHSHLVKNSPHDKTRIGWRRAFIKPENKFGCDRRIAESYIQIHDAFAHVGNTLPTWRLPQSWRPLHLLARLKLDEKKPFTIDQIKNAVDKGDLTPHSTEADVRRAAEIAGISIPKKKPKTRPIGAMPAKTASKRQRIEAALEILERLGLTVADLEKEVRR